MSSAIATVQGCTETRQVSRFRKRDQMVAAAGEHGLVQLRFPKSADRAVLYAHRSFLSCCSKVLSGLLDELAPVDSSSEQQRAKVPKVTDRSTPGATATAASASASISTCSSSVPTIPLTDEDATAWEDVLGMVYPLTPGTQVTWDNAKKLLCLADKYDCPFVIERVQSFFLCGKREYDLESTVLFKGLTAGNAFDWLVTFSKCRLDELVTVCITYIVKTEDSSLAHFPGVLHNTGLQPQHISELCSTLLCFKIVWRWRLDELRSELYDAKTSGVQPLEPAEYCSNCRCIWYCQPDSSTPTAHCVKCGIPKQRGLR